MTKTVVARRWARGWELHIDGVGTTQSKSLALAPRDAMDYIELVTGRRPARVSVTHDLGDLDTTISELRSARAEAAQASERASDLTYRLIQDMRLLGLNGDDIGRVIEVSPQRVSQLVRRVPMSRSKTRSKRIRST
jgi:hypothetical protein